MRLGLRRFTSLLPRLDFRFSEETVPPTSPRTDGRPPRRPVPFNLPSVFKPLSVPSTSSRLFSSTQEVDLTTPSRPSALPSNRPEAVRRRKTSDFFDHGGDRMPKGSTRQAVRRITTTYTDSGAVALRTSCEVPSSDSPESRVARLHRSSAENGFPLPTKCSFIGARTRPPQPTLNVTLLL